MKKYIFQNRIVDYGIDISTVNEVSSDFSESWNKHVVLSEEQIAFYTLNPTASMQEVWNMQLAVIEQPIVTNETIRLLRQQAYKTESNDFMLAYRQYELLLSLETDSEKIETLTQKRDSSLANWVSKVKEIDERLPYVE